MTRPPDLRLRVPRGEGEKTKWFDVGAAWANKDGSISIKINPCVVLTDQTTLMLYPMEKKQKSPDG